MFRFQIENNLFVAVRKFDIIRMQETITTTKTVIILDSGESFTSIEHIVDLVERYNNLDSNDA